MFPLKDDIPSKRFPIITIGLIVVNGIVFIIELLMGNYLHDFFLLYGVVPIRYTNSDIAELFSLSEQLLPFITSMFLHGGWVHLIGNMWTLWIFGDNVEDRLGHIRFLLLYLTGGIVAALMHIMTNQTSVLPTIGASGAVAAAMGAYFRLYPHANVIMVFPPFFLGPYFVAPAIVFLGWWFILQFFNGSLSLIADPNQLGGVAWWAHVGGFIYGAVLCSVIKTKHFYRRHYQEDELVPW